MSSVAGIVITRNEERNIGECLRSLAWCDERIVLDSKSTDATERIARGNGARFESREFTNFAEQRNAALALSRSDWVLFLDADERVSPKLAREIRRTIESNPVHAAYWIPRRNIIVGHRMRGGGWWPDDQLRLLRTGTASYDPEIGVHEVAHVEGASGKLTTPLIHYNYRTVRQLFSKQSHYSRHAAEDLQRQGIIPRPHSFLLQPIRAFHRRFVQWNGYRDGMFGAALAALLAWYELVTYVRLARRTGLRGYMNNEPEVPASSTADSIPPGPYRDGISVVIVSWNVRELLRDCLASLRDREPGDRPLEVAVVDNGSTDGSVEMVRQEFPEVILSVASDNPGFAASNNSGAAGLSGAYLLILNPDTVVRPGALRSLRCALQSDAGLWAAGPRLVEADGSTQSSRRRFPTLSSLLVESTPLEQWPGFGAIGRELRMERPEDADLPADWLVGACLLVRREVWDRLGGMDAGFHMYFEETDLFRRAARLGWRARYVPEAEVVHYYGKSSEQNIAARHIRFNASKFRYAKKHFGPAIAGVLAMHLRLLFAVQGTEEGLKLLLGHRPELRRQRLREIGKVLAAGWPA